jgi:hypothetical protein
MLTSDGIGLCGGLGGVGVGRRTGELLCKAQQPFVRVSHCVGDS